MPATSGCSSPVCRADAGGAFFIGCQRGCDIDDVSAAGRITELRVELPADEVAVLDGHCQALGLDRTKVVRELLRQWSERELHRATVICRVAGRHPAAPESAR